jgi:hypothetical protein
MISEGKIHSYTSHCAAGWDLPGKSLRSSYEVPNLNRFSYFGIKALTEVLQSHLAAKLNADNQ